jgi:membrane-associated phospholipid phosphatase
MRLISRTSCSCFALSAIFAIAVQPAEAKNSSIESAGTIVAIALPITAASISASKSDWDGILQMTVATLATVGTSYLLKTVVHEDRPDHSDNKSFPSDTAALAFAPAQFLWQRYGWEYGVPAYAAASFVGYSRVEAKQHHWWDVAASAGISIAFNEWITDRYEPRHRFETGAYLLPGGGYLALNYRF